MAKAPTYYRDRHILCRKVERKGQAPRIDMFNDRRAGLTFPTGNNPGYWCVFGQKKTATHRDKLPLELLAEGENQDQRSLFLSMIKAMRMLRCQYVYADCSRSMESAEIEFDRTLNSLGVKTIGLWDASEFDGFEAAYGNFEAARGPAFEYGRKGMLIIPGGYKAWGNPDKGRHKGDCLLKQELARMGVDEAKSTRPWEQYPAANAFNHVVMSYVISPWVKPSKDAFNMDQEGYCG